MLKLHISSIRDEALLNFFPFYFLEDFPRPDEVSPAGLEQKSAKFL
jgi:hypothetical protein